MELKIIPVKQKKNYCGPASLAMVLSFYGINQNQEDLAKATGTDKTGICKEEDILKVAKTFGFGGYIKNNSNLEEVKSLIENNIPVIVDWNSPEENGHYSVVVGFDNSSILLADPHFGEIKKYDIAWFEDKWFDSFEGKEIKKEIIVISK